MDFLSDIWRGWNDQWGASIATIVALIALLKTTGKEIKLLVTTVWRWKVLTFVSKPYRYTITKYRSHGSKTLIQLKLERETILVGIQVYESCLQSDPRQSTRKQLREITPDKPIWLNDYYVATALESLSAEGKVAKAVRYSRNSWPPKSERYQFVTVNDNESAQDIATRIETDDMCLVYQRGAGCSKPPRFEARSFAETVSPRETRFTASFPLKEMAPPCELCWEKEYRERDTRNLVESFIRYDFGDAATAEITGADGELQEALVSLFVECDYTPEVNFLKPLVRQAITIRQEQISARTPGSQGEWLPDDKRELTETLREQIKGQSGK